VWVIQWFSSLQGFCGLYVQFLALTDPLRPQYDLSNGFQRVNVDSLPVAHFGSYLCLAAGLVRAPPGMDGFPLARAEMDCQAPSPSIEPSRFGHITASSFSSARPIRFVSTVFPGTSRSNCRPGYECEPSPIWPSNAEFGHWAPMVPLNFLARSKTFESGESPKGAPTKRRMTRDCSLEIWDVKGGVFPSQSGQVEASKQFEGGWTGTFLYSCDGARTEFPAQFS